MKTAQLMTAADASVNQTSIPAEPGDLTSLAIQATFSSATLNGTTTIEASVDNVTYVTVSGSSNTVTSGAAVLYDIPRCGYRFVRLKWVGSSGTGTVTVICDIKEPPIPRG